MTYESTEKVASIYAEAMDQMRKEAIMGPAPAVATPAPSIGRSLMNVARKAKKVGSNLWGRSAPGQRTLLGSGAMS